MQLNQMRLLEKIFLFFSRLISCSRKHQIWRKKVKTIKQLSNTKNHRTQIFTFYQLQKEKVSLRKCSCFLMYYAFKDMWYHWMPDYLGISSGVCSVVRFYEHEQDHRASWGWLKREFLSRIIMAWPVVCLFYDSSTERKKKGPKTKQRGCEQSHYPRMSLRMSLRLSQTRTKK